MVSVNRRRALLGAGAYASLSLPGGARAAEWPVRPVTIVVPWPAGGSTDALARAISRRLGDVLKQTFVVDNRAGANGNIGASLVARSKPDGNMLMFTSNGPLSNSVLLYRRLPFDPLKDFVPVAAIAETAVTVCASNAVPARDLRELTDWARKNPGQLKVGNPSNGSVGHLASKLWQFTEDIEFIEVPYPGTAPLLNGLLSGVVDVAFDLAASYVPQVKAGSLKALAVTTEARIPDASEIPTAVEQGFAYLVVAVFFGLVAPAGTSAEVVRTLSTVMSDFVRSAEGQAQILQAGAIPKLLGPEEFRRAQIAEVAKWRPIVEKGSIQLN